MADRALPSAAFIPYSPTVRAVRGGGGTGAPENYVFATIAALIVSGSFVAVSDGCRHWFVFPLMICAIFTGADIVAWARGKLDTLDPRALVAILLYHNMFLAPLLHQAWGAHTEEWAHHIHDWAPWFGMYGFMSATGLICYKAAQHYVFRAASPGRTYWALNDGRFATALAGALAISAVAAAVVVLRYGGLRREEHESLVALGSGLQHLSWLLALSDPFPLLLTMMVVRILADPRRKTSLFTVIVVIVVLAVAEFSFLGLRGSRSAVMYILFLGAATVHYRLRRIPVSWAIVGGVILFTFIYYYGFFKARGAAGFAALQSAEQRKYLEGTTGNTVTKTLLGDLSRAEMQTYMLYRLWEHPDRYNYRWGMTYWRGIITIIPRAIWYDKPPGKTEAGTDLQYGEGASSKKERISTRVYALAGEAMLNFGFIGVPMAFLGYGALLGWYRKKLGTWQFGDARFYIAPLLTLMAMAGIFGDSDNVAFSFLKNGALPILVILYSSSRRPLPTAQRA